MEADNTHLDSCDLENDQKSKLVQAGTVVKLEAQTAVVRVSVSSACAGCHSKCTLAGEHADRFVNIPLLPDYQYRIGEIVDLEINPRYIFNISVLVYLIPTILLIVFAYTGNLIANHYNISDPNLGALLGIGVAIPVIILFITSMQRIYSKTNQIKVIPRSGANG